MPPGWALISLGIILFLVTVGSSIHLVSCHPLTPGTTAPSDTTTQPPNTTTPPPDTTAPVISKINIAGYTGETATITWETDEDTMGQVEYGTTDAYGKLAATDGELTTSHSVELTGLQPNTTYHFRVNSTDGSGNEAGSGDQAFTTWVAEKDWKEYVNEEYGFSIQFPEKCGELPNLLWSNYHLAAFRSGPFTTGVSVLAFDADEPISADWIVKTWKATGAQDPKVKSDLRQITLSDGTKATQYEATLYRAAVKTYAICVEADTKDGKRRIRVVAWSLLDGNFFDEALFSQISHTLRFSAE